MVSNQFPERRCVGWRRGHRLARLDGVGGNACTSPQTHELDTRRSCHVLLALGEKPPDVWLLLVSVEGGAVAVHGQSEALATGVLPAMVNPPTFRLRDGCSASTQ